LIRIESSHALAVERALTQQWLTSIDC
jgi:hypothetical protein